MTAIFLSLLLLFQKAPFVPPGAVEGQLLNNEGAPAIAVRVVAVAVPGGNGIPDQGVQYFDVYPPVSSTQTDNDGHFSMMDIPPGRYYILAGDSGQGSYFPGSPDIRKASPVTVKSNEIVDNLDFRISSHYGGKISGHVNGDMAALGPKTATITGPPLQDVIEVPVGADGNFQLPQLPPSTYLLSLYPPTSGIASVRVKVGDADVSGEQLTPLPTQTVTGRIVVNKGPIPIVMLGFETIRTHVGATVNADGTFNVQLHAATHQVDIAGLPIGYSIASVHIGPQDATQGIPVGNKDITDVVINLNAPQHLAVIRGRITGLAPTRFSSTRVELTGLIFGALQANVRQDGTFEFPAVIPGAYTLKLNQVPEFSSMLVSADSANTFDVTVVVPSP